MYPEPEHHDPAHTPIWGGNFRLCDRVLFVLEGMVHEAVHSP